MRITLLSGVDCTPDRGTAVDFETSEFLDELGGINGTASLECLDAAAKLRGPGFVLAQYQDGATDKLQASIAADSWTDVLCYDIDGQTRAEIDAVWPGWQTCDAAGCQCRDR